MLVVYYAIVPPSKPRYFGVLGMEFSDKAFTFCLAGMVRQGRETNVLPHVRSGRRGGAVKYFSVCPEGIIDV